MPSSTSFSPTRTPCISLHHPARAGARVTMYLPEKDRVTNWKKEVLDYLVVVMGGRVAENLPGRRQQRRFRDIQQATRCARAMVCDWGMSDKLGMVQYGDDSSMNFFGRDMGGSRGYSEKTAEAIDAEVLHLVSSAYDKAREIIGAHRDAMEKITAALLEYETLDGKHIKDIIEHGRMLTPPPAPLSRPPIRRPRSRCPSIPRSRRRKTTAACSRPSAPAGA